MLEQQKEFFRRQLQTDASKSFTSEFIRTTNLERRIVDEFGFEGIKLIFENRNSENYFLLGQFPQNCCWSNLNNESLLGFVQKNFMYIEEHLPMLLETIADRCRYIFAEKRNDIWRLHYFLDMVLYDNRKYFKVYTGGEPSRTPQINENLRKYGWTIPQDLAQVYSVHNGFGKINSSYLLSSSEIRIMAEMMNPICKENNYDIPKEYKFEDLLEFFPNGAGNTQCFHRKNDNSFYALTVDWDHETWEISGESSFFNFIDERMSEIDEE